MGEVVRKGTKHDAKKPNLALIPKDAIWGMAAALTFGAEKYGKHNFREGLEYTALVAATMRHLTAWVEGENNDTESLLSHLDHALASLAMLKYMEQNKKDMDDRYKPEEVVGSTDEDDYFFITDDLDLSLLEINQRAHDIAVTKVGSRAYNLRLDKSEKHANRTTYKFSLITDGESG